MGDEEEKEGGDRSTSGDGYCLTWGASPDSEADLRMPSLPISLIRVSQRGPGGQQWLNSYFIYEETEARPCGFSNGAPGEWFPLSPQDPGPKALGGGRGPHPL